MSDAAADSETPVKPTFWQAIGGALNTFAEDLFLGHERGSAIVFLAALEDAVRNAIASRLVMTGENCDKLIGGDESPGALGFADQCRLAYCLGLFGNATLADLKILARVRNRFAHGGRVVTFKDGRIEDLCRSLKVCDKFGDSVNWYRHLQKQHLHFSANDARSRYTTSAVVLTIAMTKLSEQSLPLPQFGPVLLD
jgi:hypothetical protein